MESNQSKMESNPSHKTQKCSVSIQVLLRSMAFATSLAASVLMATNKEIIDMYGFIQEANFKCSPSFSFHVGGVAVASFYSLLSLASVFILKSKGSNSRISFFIFLFDLMMMGLVLAASSAATAIAYVGKYGNEVAAWGAICGYASKFCDRAQLSLICSYVSFLIFLLIHIISANRPKHT